jgi:hypothetical protein
MKLQNKLLLFFGIFCVISMIPSKAAAQQSITCESNNGSRKYCGSANPGQVTMQKQLSQTQCIQGQSWGVDNRGLWVDRGCRAVFNLYGGNGNGGNWGGNNGSNQVTCESKNGGRQYCGNVGNATMNRQLSQSACVQGQSWGVDNRGLWVDRGCRAVFNTYGGSGGNNGGNWGGNNPGISNYPRINVDTSGRGTFSSRSFGSGNVTRGYVDTKNQPSVSLSGSGGFKITFYGVITQADNRRMTMQINRSSRGSANGTAEIYLNGDKNEVQSINLNGNNFNGSFTRN